MTEQEQTIERLVARTGHDPEELRHLLERQGLSEEEILLLAQNDDLWLLEPPELRYFSADAEEEAEEWKKVARILDDLATASAGGGLFDSIGVQALLADAAVRADELRRRAERRAQGAA